MKPSEHVEKLEFYAKNAKDHAEAEMDDREAADRLALQSCILDSTLAICAHLADLASAIRGD